MRVRESRDSKRIKSPQDASYYSCGIPQRFWAQTTYKPRFLPIVDGKDILAQERVQQGWLHQIKDQSSWRSAYTVVIGSEPTDTESLSVMFDIARTMADVGVRMMIQDMGMYDENEHERSVVYFAHNILGDVDRSRATRIRDWVSDHDDSLRILAVAGDPFRFAMDVIHSEASMYLYLNGARAINVSRG